HESSIDDEWSRLLPVIAVCRKWRVIALVLAYKLAFIICSPERAPGSLSNIGIMSYGLEYLAKSLSIYVISHTGFNKSLQQILDILHTNAHDLQDICSMKLWIYEHIGDYEEYVSNPSTDIDSIPPMAKEFTKCVPNVTKLHCTALQQFPSTIAFYKSLASSYGSRLHVLSTKPMYMPEKAELSEAITDLRLHCRAGIPKQIAPLKKESLVRLSLICVNSYIDWGWFEDKSGPGNINFENLQYMCISIDCSTQVIINGEMRCINRGPKTKFTHRLSVPRLEHLSIKLCSLACSLLKSAAFPQKLQRFDIKCMNGYTFHFRGVDMDSSLVDVFSKYAYDINGEMSEVKFLNDILRISSTLAQEATLSINSETRAWCIDSLYPVNVTRVQVTSYINYSNMVEIIAAFPNLAALRAYGVTHSAKSNAAAERTIPTNLEHLVVGVIGQNMSVEASGLLQERLFRIFKSLKSVVVF
ncbi:hypothetical protein BX070DRAFT_257799, partial [Coemansia spiralis]